MVGVVKRIIHTLHGSTDGFRPTNKRNAEYDEPQLEGEPFNFDAVPNRFFFNVETVGGLEPDVIMQQGIKVLQQKLAAVIQELTGGEDRGGADDGFGGARSPDMNGAGGYGVDQGYTTPYQAGGSASAWGGAQTPYGATPYGNSGNPW